MYQKNYYQERNKLSSIVRNQNTNKINELPEIHTKFHHVRAVPTHTVIAFRLEFDAI